MKRTQGKLAAVVAVALCAIAVLLVVARTMVLDSATMQMKTGEFDRAATKLKSLANIGDSTAQSLVGDLYAYGWGVSKDDETAVYWYRRAGPLGPPDQAGPPVSDAAAPAMYYVGKRYMEGLGVKHDENEARKWFVRSANGGFSKADEELKRMH